MGERISDSCVRPVVTFSVYLSPLPYTHGPYDHILSIKENHTGKNSKPIPATAAYLSYLLVRPSFASSDRNLLCLPSPRPGLYIFTCAGREAAKGKGLGMRALPLPAVWPFREEVWGPWAHDFPYPHTLLIPWGLNFMPPYIPYARVMGAGIAGTDI